MPVFSMCAAPHMGIKHCSEVIVSQEDGLEFSAGLVHKIGFYACHGEKIVPSLPYNIVIESWEKHESPPHGEHNCGRLLLEDRERIKTDQRLYRLPISPRTSTLSLRLLAVSYLLCGTPGHIIWKTCIVSTERLAFYQDNVNTWSLMVHSLVTQST